RNFSALFGANNVTNMETQGTWTPLLKTTPYMWAYGCGAGSLASVAGLGNTDAYHKVTTPELYTNDIQAVFTQLFGSWLGDWDGKDDIMRCVLALPSYGLASVWSGRPHWFLQHMGLGEPIGYGARLTQNNGANGLYRNQINTAAGQIHVALMGDPTLRLHVVAPPTGLSATTNGATVNLAWTPSIDPVVGYHVYRMSAADGSFTRLTSSPVIAPSFIDNGATGAVNYMVRAVSLQVSPSGSYFNPSVGTFLIPAAASAGGTSNPSTGDGGSATNIVPVVVAGGTVWVDDALPSGAIPGTDGGDAWNWVAASPAPYAGHLANQSSLSSGLHQHFFTSATQTLTVNAGDSLFAAVYLDPNNPPSEIMLQWNDGSSWEHRAFWGADLITYGSLGSASRARMGALPAAGRWVLLQVPASQVALVGAAISGMAFSQVDGRATWDYVGKALAGTTVPTPGTGTGGESSGSTTNVA